MTPLITKVPHDDEGLSQDGFLTPGSVSSYG